MPTSKTTMRTVIDKQVDATNVKLLLNDASIETTIAVDASTYSGKVRRYNGLSLMCGGTVIFKSETAASASFSTLSENIIFSMVLEDLTNLQSYLNEWGGASNYRVDANTNLFIKTVEAQCGFTFNMWTAVLVLLTERLHADTEHRNVNVLLVDLNIKQ